MSISGFDMLFYTLAFVVPGFILNNTVTIFIPQKSEQPQIAFLKFIYFSCLNYGIWSWLIYLLFKTNYSINHPIWTAFIWATIILISPLVLGIIIGIISEKQYVRIILQKIGLTPAHMIPTGWDYWFSKAVGDNWIIVTLKDDTIIPGKFGSRSFASSDPNDRDLYLEEVYSISEENEWVITPGTGGILINGDQIKYIEFFN